MTLRTESLPLLIFKASFLIGHPPQAPFRLLEKDHQNWSGKRDSNPRPSAWKADALATELLPLIRSTVIHLQTSSKERLFINGGGGRIRTSVGCAGRFTVCSLWPLGNPSRFCIANWSWRWDSNPQPADYKSAALPVELRQQNYFIFLG
jgi:hypothetical protein